MSLRQALPLALACSAACNAADSAPNPGAIRLPPGFEISVVTDAVPSARQMALSSNGTLFVGSLRAGKVYAVLDADRNFVADEVVVIDEGLTMPSGLALAGPDLYVAALDRVLKFADVEKQLRDRPEPAVVTDALPDKRHHGWKVLRFGQDGELYVPVGAPCNICLSDDPRFAAILRMDPATGATTVHARGIRNTVGMAVHPETGELWFSDNGRDMMGDDVPAEEINRVTAAGQHFGYPFIHAGDVPDPEFGAGKSPEAYVPPIVKIQAHSAALGITWYTGSAFPPHYRNALFVAEHGSWNRSSKVGYQVSVVRFDGASPAYEPFATGWLQGEKAWGRPNDVLMAPDGSLLISDDAAGAIYRVTFSGGEPGAASP